MFKEDSSKILKIDSYFPIIHTVKLMMIRVGTRHGRNHLADGVDTERKIAARQLQNMPQIRLGNQRSMAYSLRWKRKERKEEK